MLVRDDRGVAWTVGDRTSATALFAAMESYFTFRSDSLELLEALLAADAEVPAAQVLTGYLLLFARSAEKRPAAGAALAAARDLSHAATARERLHIDALSAWFEGDVLGAQRRWDAILTETPHDLLALRVQHMNAMFLGRPDYLRALGARALGAWSDAVPGAGYVYGMACMGFEETRDFARAEDLGRRGHALEPDDLWCVHSVAHVMEAEGRLDEGLAWTARPESYWDNRGPMRHHLWWHEALFLYEAGRLDQALDYYDRRLAPEGQIGYMELSNSAALLLRLEAAGVGCGDRWTALAAACAPMLGDRSLTFGDIHLLLALAGALDSAGLARLKREIEAHADGTGFDAEAARRIAVPVANAMAARLAGDPKAATDSLLAARFDFPRMGGSNAQRDVLDVLLIDCASDAGDVRLARSLLHEYLDLRPGSAPMQAKLATLDKAA